MKLTQPQLKLLLAVYRGERQVWEKYPPAVALVRLGLATWGAHRLQLTLAGLKRAEDLTASAHAGAQHKKG